MRADLPFMSAPKCGARTRAGGLCKGLAVRGKRRCRMHGGTNPGAPKGNKNAWKHGERSAAAIEWRRMMRELLAENRRVVEAV
jgi:uncharacterized protein YjcR